MAALRAPTVEQFAAMALSALALGVGLGPAISAQGRAVVTPQILAVPVLAATAAGGDVGDADPLKERNMAKATGGGHHADPVPFAPKPELPSPIPAPFTQTAMPDPAPGDFYGGAGDDQAAGEDQVAGEAAGKKRSGEGGRDGTALEEPVESEAESVLTGTVIQAVEEAGRFAVADGAGLVLTVNAERLPATGTRVRIPIVARPDGTFDEAGPRRRLGSAKRVEFGGTLTYIDAAGRGYTVSNLGSSVAVATAEPSAEELRLGARVEVEAAIESLVPAPSGQPEGAPAAEPVDALDAPATGVQPERPPADPAPATPAVPDASAPPAAPEAPPADPCSLSAEEVSLPAAETAVSLRQRSVKEVAEPAEVWNVAARAVAVCDGGSRLLLSADSAGFFGSVIAAHLNEKLARKAPAPGSHLTTLVRLRPNGILALRSLNATRTP